MQRIHAELRIAVAIVRSISLLDFPSSTFPHSMLSYRLTSTGDDHARRDSHWD